MRIIYIVSIVFWTMFAILYIAFIVCGCKAAASGEPLIRKTTVSITKPFKEKGGVDEGYADIVGEV